MLFCQLTKFVLTSRPLLGLFALPVSQIPTPLELLFILQDSPTKAVLQKRVGENLTPSESPSRAS